MTTVLEHNLNGFIPINHLLFFIHIILVIITIDIITVILSKNVWLVLQNVNHFGGLNLFFLELVIIRIKLGDGNVILDDFQKRIFVQIVIPVIDFTPTDFKRLMTAIEIAIGREPYAFYFKDRAARDTILRITPEDLQFALI